MPLTLDQLMTGDVTIIPTDDFSFLEMFYEGGVWAGPRQIGLDIETEGVVKPHLGEIATVQIALDDVCWVVNWAMPLTLEEVPYVEYLRMLIEDDSVVKVIHNAAFELKWFFKTFGLDLHPEAIWDTMGGEYVLAEGSDPETLTIETSMKKLGLGPTVERRYGIEMDKDKALRVSFRRVGAEVVMPPVKRGGVPKCKTCEKNDAVFQCSKGRACAECREKEDLFSRIKQWKEVDPEPYLPHTVVCEGLTPRQLEYAAFDAFWVLVLQQDQVDEATAHQFAESNSWPALDIIDLDNKATEVVARIEFHGAPMDTEALMLLDGWWKYEEMRLRERIQEEFYVDGVDFVNINAPEAMVAALNERGIKVASYEASELKHYRDNPLIADILAWKKYTKFVNTYTKSFLEKVYEPTGRIYPDFNQFRTATARLSSSGPNYQNLPSKDDIAAELRAAVLKAPEGKVFVSADYSQIELRLIAEMYGCPMMRKAFQEDMDLHALTGSRIMGVSYEKMLEELKKEKKAGVNGPYSVARMKAKAPNFGLGYGAGAKRLMEMYWDDYGIAVTLSEAQIGYNAYHDSFPGVGAHHKRIANEIEHGVGAFYVQTLDGRRRKMPRRWFDSKTKKTKSCYSAALNTPIQGTGGDMVKKVVIELCRKVQIVNIVHDEIILMCDEHEAEEIKEMLEESMRRIGQSYLKTVPIKVDATISKEWKK